MLKYSFVSTIFVAVLSISQIHVVQADWMKEMLDRVNEEREKVNADNLCYNEKLIDAAEMHADDMINKNFFSHTGSDGSSPGDRIEKAKYDWNAYGENIAWGQSSVKIVMNAWMNSPGHKQNILSKNFAHFGAAWKEGRWVQVFGNSRIEKCLSGPTPPGPSPTPPGPSPTPPGPSPTPPTKATCGDLGPYSYLENDFCNKRANREWARFARFWEIKDGSEEEVLAITCQGKTCKRRECCTRGPGRRCTNTGPYGLKPGGFTEEMCGDGMKLKPRNALRRSKCTGEGGRKCWQYHCCVEE